MSSGALTNLIATGAIDTYLTLNATFTFWKLRYSKHTAFAVESCSQPFNTTVGFGTEAQITLNRQGDLCYYTYVCITLPGIVACDLEKEKCAGIGPGNQFPVYMDQSCAPCAKNDEAALAEYLDTDGFSEASTAERATKLKAARDKWLKDKYGHATSLDCCDDVEDCPDNMCPELGNVWCHWVNGVGQYLLKTAKIIIGGSTVDTLHNDFLYIWEELSGKPVRPLTELTAKRHTRAQLGCASRQARTLYVPLPFWYCQHSGNALSLASLQFHGVQVHVDFAKLTDCIVVSSSNVAVKNAASACCLTPSDLKACMEVTYVFLENAERERFATNHFEVLITQNQAFYMQANNSQLRIQLNFNHPTTELIFAIRRACHERCNNHFNFSGVDGRDPLINCSLQLNNQSRFGTKNAVYMRCVQPYQHHSNIPDAFVYVFSFALNPEDVSPSGTCNMSRIDHVDLNLTIQEALGKEQCTIMVFARSFNIIRYREGLAGLAFAN